MALQLTRYRQLIQDEEITSNVKDETCIYNVFIRLRAVCVRFEKVDFSHCVFDACYIRNCEFIECNFSGARFVNTQLPGTSFKLPRFEYATFEKTTITDEILSNCCPSHWKQIEIFARNLRMNYTQLGMASSVNKAIKMELQGRRNHLHDVVFSKTSYYRDRFNIQKRAKGIPAYFSFVTLDFIWGHGESLFALIRTIFIVIAGLAVYEFCSNGYDVRNAMIDGAKRLVVSSSKATDPTLLVLGVAIAKITLFAMLTSMLFRRMSRR